MATDNKDFKVKNGLAVTNGGTFGGTVTVATPTENEHAATKEYVDLRVGAPSIPVGDTPPANSVDGQLWYDTLTGRVYVYYAAEWSAIANLSDAEFLQDHIHDTAIDGSGLIVSVFMDAGYYNAAGAIVDAGFYSTTTWENTWDGGIAIDNFN